MTSELTLHKDGAVRLDRAALSLLPRLEDAIADELEQGGNVRISGNRELAALFHNVKTLPELLGQYYLDGMSPVRAILFDKTPQQNWSLGWHQDRTIAVMEKREVSGFGLWSVKAGIVHVEPPFSIMENLYTIRIHLDDVDENNAPLLIAAGSHHFGRVTENHMHAATDKCTIKACTAQRGDIWLYHTPILHASSAARSGKNRRVLQMDLADFALPDELEWAGI